MTHFKLEPETRRSILLNLIDAAQHVEDVFRPALLPNPVGLYLPEKFEPVIRAGQPYWLEIATPSATPGIYRYFYEPVVYDPYRMRNAPGDIVDKPDGLGQVALPHYLAASTSEKPFVPYYGTKIVTQMIENHILSSRAFLSERELRMEEVVMPYLRPEYHNLDYLCQEATFQHLFTIAHEGVLMILQHVREFLRGNAYQMCELHATDLGCVRVDQLGDFRIIEWHKNKASGLW